MERIEQMRQAQKLARKLERVCDVGDLYAWFEGTHIGTTDDRATVIFGDCPWTELEFDAKNGEAFIYVGRFGKARVPKRAMYELGEFFSALHNC
ncbi:MAG: hypothetical protein IJG33_03145 [Selenomonadaceae bacterium]|nr:hypothetical protein [Selenomonadaceae bacterium]